MGNALVEKDRLAVVNERELSGRDVGMRKKNNNKVQTTHDASHFTQRE